jgi:CheY-like chemotaxis protein
MLLKRLGYDVCLAHDGLEAVEVATAVQPEIVLLDIGLPKLNGYDAGRLIREKCPDRNLVLVALTGWGQPDDRRRSEEAGFDAHLVKPVDIKALMEVFGRS